MASHVKKIWEKRASNADAGDVFSKTASLDSGMPTRRKTLDVVNKFEAMASSEKAANQELAKISSAYRPCNADEGSGANKENELRSKMSLREIAKETVINGGNGRMEKTTEKIQLRQRVVEIKKSLNEALTALNDVSARLDKM